MSRPRLLQLEIKDEYTRRNFEFLQKLLNTFPLYLASFQFVELEFDAAVSLFEYKHNLGFIPKDVIQTSLIGTGTVTWVYDQFDKENLIVTATGPCTVRAFVGSYQEGGI